MKRYLPWGAAVAVVLIVIVAALGRARDETPAENPADSGRSAVLGPTDVAIAARADLIAGVPVSGTLEPAVDIRLTAPIPQVVEAVLVKEGETVRQGQVLARFRSDVVGAQAQSAEAQRRLAASDYERMQTLFREGAVSQRDVENAEVALRTAEAVAAHAREQADDAVVRAPVAGVIAQRSVDAGDRVGDGDPVFRLVNTRELEFAAAVPTEYAVQVRVGAPVALGVSGLSATSVAGRVSRINATTDQATRQVRVYVTVSNPGSRLVGGLFASGRIVLRQVRGAVAVPQPAVRTDAEGKQFVWVVDGGRIARRDVTTGVVDEPAGLIEIKTGLSGGETVVVGPAEGLRDGQRADVTGREG